MDIHVRRSEYSLFLIITKIHSIILYKYVWRRGDQPQTRDRRGLQAFLYQGMATIRGTTSFLFSMSYSSDITDTMHRLFLQACQKRVAEDTTGEAHCTGQVCCTSPVPEYFILCWIDCDVIRCSILIIGIAWINAPQRNCSQCSSEGGMNSWGRSSLKGVACTYILWMYLYIFLSARSQTKSCNQNERLSFRKVESSLQRISSPPVLVVRGRMSQERQKQETIHLTSYS